VGGRSVTAIAIVLELEGVGENRAEEIVQSRELLTVRAVAGARPVDLPLDQAGVPEHLQCWETVA
jgi:hypothetical protein